jgi:hypothetical protein
MAKHSIRSDLLEFKDGPTVEWYGFRALADNLPTHRPGLYLILNLLNGWPYIGIGEDLWRRLRAHAKRNSPKKLKAAIIKNGKNNFLIFPLFYAAHEGNDLPLIEADTIQTFDAIEHGYNICAAKGRIGPYGPAHSAAVRAGQTKEGRARQAAAAKAAYPAMAEKLHAARDAAAKSPEARAIVSARSKALWADPEWRAQVIEKSKKTKAATKAERSAKIKASWVGADERRRKTAETLAAVVAADPTLIRKGIETRRRRHGNHASSETKAKMSVAQTARFARERAADSMESSVDR